MLPSGKTRMLSADTIEILCLRAWICKEQAEAQFDWDEVAYQQGRIDAYLEVERLQEEELDRNGL